MRAGFRSATLRAGPDHRCVLCTRPRRSMGYARSGIATSMLLWLLSWPEQRAAGIDPIIIRAYFGAGSPHPHLRGGTVGDWPLNVFTDHQAALELSTLRAIAARERSTIWFCKPKATTASSQRSADGWVANADRGLRADRGASDDRARRPERINRLGVSPAKRFLPHTSLLFLARTSTADGSSVPRIHGFGVAPLSRGHLGPRDGLRERGRLHRADRFHAARQRWRATARADRRRTCAECCFGVKAAAWPLTLDGPASDDRERPARLCSTLLLSPGLSERLPSRRQDRLWVVQRWRLPRRAVRCRRRPPREQCPCCKAGGAHPRSLSP